MTTVDTLIGAATIFLLRVINNSMGTISVIVIIRQQRILASVLAFIEALVWAIVVANVIKDLSNWLNLAAYCGGFAVGSYTGMALEARLISSYVTVTITTRDGGHDLAAKLRAKGYGVTESQGEGRDGKVALLHSTIARRNLPALLRLVQELNPQAFVSVEEILAVQRGYLPSSGPSNESGD